MGKVGSGFLSTPTGALGRHELGGVFHGAGVTGRLTGAGFLRSRSHLLVVPPDPIWISPKGQTKRYRVYVGETVISTLPESLVNRP